MTLSRLAPRLALAGGLWLAAVGPLAANPYSVGVAKVDITPPGPIWLAGYGNRNHPSDGVDHPLYARAVAIKDQQGPPLVLLAADIIGWPRPVAEAVAERIGREHNVPRANILLVASHTHTGPVIGENLKTMFELKGADLEAVKVYTDGLQEKCVAVAGEALGKLGPANLSFGRGTASFAANRRVFRPGGVNFGVNPTGVVDHDVPVLRIDNSDGSVKAVLFGYACHCTTLGGDTYRISGDWAGFAADYLERSHPGAVALFVTGCGADANPEPRGRLDFARQHGLEIAGAVSRALKGTRAPVAGPLRAAFDRVDLPFGPLPTKEEWEKRAQSPEAVRSRHARRQLEVIERDGRLPTGYPCPVQAWQLGNGLTLVAIGGEVCVDYALRLKREFPQLNLWVAGYANDVFAYVPSVRILIEGGYEAEYAMLYYGLPGSFSRDVEELLVKKVLDVMQKAQAGP